MAGNKEFSSRPHPRPPTPPSPPSTPESDPKLQPLLRQHNTNPTFQPIKLDVPIGIGIWEEISDLKMVSRLIWGLSFVFFLFTILYFASTLSAVTTNDSKVSLAVSIKELQMTFDMLSTKVENLVKLETTWNVILAEQKEMLEILTKLNQMQMMKSPRVTSSNKQRSVRVR